MRRGRLRSGLAPGIGFQGTSQPPLSPLALARQGGVSRSGEDSKARGDTAEACSQQEASGGIGVTLHNHCGLLESLATTQATAGVTPPSRATLDGGVTAQPD